VRHAIRNYVAHFLAVIALMLLAAGVATYILSQQNFRFPIVEEGPFRVDAVLKNARAVAPGQGQSVRVAGVKIGDIGDVELEDGRAVVTLEVEKRFKGLLRNDSTALLRPKTGLKDMFIELDPGHGAPMDEGERIEIANTAPDVDLDEVLAVLDEDGRDYLKLLISGAGKGIDGRGADLREALKRLGPTVRDSARVTRASARRKRELRSLVHHYGLLAREVGRSDREIVRLVRGSNAVFGAIAPEEQALSRSVAELPGTLRSAQTTLVRVGALGRRLRPALDALRPSVRRLAPTGEAVLPLAREATPILRDRIRPLARVGRTELEELGVGARRIARAAPDLERALVPLNRLLNLLAYNPGGTEGLTGDLAKDRARQEGFLHWLAWNAQNGITAFGTSDGQGVFRRFTFGNTSCTVFNAIGIPTEITDLLAAAQLCGDSSP
jgi:phospholipid/cholesterol/gamma-HCH transport system substrate-binding protein